MASGAIMAVAAVAGAAVSAYGAIRQGQQAKEASEYNAKQSELAAAQAKEKAAYDAETSSMQFQELMGKQKALYAKAGVDLSSGSPLLTMSFQAEQAERDKQAILYSGKTASDSAITRASLFRNSGSDSQTAGYISGGSTFLSGLANTYTASQSGKSGVTNNYYNV